MAGLFILLEDRFGMGPEPLEVLQEKALRIASLSFPIAFCVAKKTLLQMSVTDIVDAALISRVVHPENEGIYNGKEPFDKVKNMQRGQYSIRVAEERGIELTELQKKVVLGQGDLLESQIIKLAETIIAMQYKRIQRGIEKDAVTDAASIVAEILSDNRINAELVTEIIGEQELKELIDAERKFTFGKN